MYMRWVGAILVVFFGVQAAFAQQDTDDDPFSERYSVRGVEPWIYTGFGDYWDQVRALVMEDRLSLPADLPLDYDGELEPRSIAILTEAALDHWGIHLLTIRMDSRRASSDDIEVRLKWPTDARALDDFPFDAMRRAFDAANLDPDSPAWVAQRNRLWPDAAVIASRVVVSERVLDVSSCPGFVTELRRLRDAPPSLEMLSPYESIGGDHPDRPIIITTDGWGVSMVWNGGPNRFNGGRAGPDQSSELGATAIALVREAGNCLGVESP